MGRWPVVRLGEIAKIVSGGTPSRTNSAFWDGDIPWVKTGEIRNGVIGADDIDEYITESGLSQSSARIIPAGTILMAMYGQGGTRGRASVLGLDAAINQACAAVILRDGIYRDYVFQTLRFQYDRIRRMSNAGSQDNLSADILRSITMPLPPLDEQRRIADILATWDTAIDKTVQLIASLRRRNTLLAKELVAGAAHGRHSVLLQDIATLRVGRTPSRSVAKYWCSNHASADSHVWLSIADLAAGGVITESKERISDFAVRECGMRPVEKGTLLLSFKLTLGRTAIAGRLLFTNEAIVALTPRGEGFEPSFLCYVLPLLHWETAGNRAAKGRTLNREALQALRLPNVPLPEQRRIAAILNRAGREVDLLELLTLAYKRQKRGLMAGCLSTDGSRS